MVIMPNNVCKIIYYDSKRANPCVFTNYNHKGCSSFESCTYSGKSNSLGDLDLNDGYVEIYTCSRDNWKISIIVISIIAFLILSMITTNYFITKKQMRIKSI